MGGCWTGQKDKDGNEKDFNARQTEPCIHRQPYQRKKGSEGVTLSGGMHSSVEVWQAQETDGSCQVEEQASADQKDCQDLHLKCPLPLKVLGCSNRHNEVQQSIDQRDIDKHIRSAIDESNQEEERQGLRSNHARSNKSIEEAGSKHDSIET